MGKMKRRRGYIRKSLVGRPASIKELQELLGVGGESQATRLAIRDCLLAEKLAAAADRMAERGGLLDIFSRVGPASRKV